MNLEPKPSAEIAVMTSDKTKPKILVRGFVVGECAVHINFIGNLQVTHLRSGLNLQSLYLQTAKPSFKDKANLGIPMQTLNEFILYAQELQRNLPETFFSSIEKELSKEQQDVLRPIAMQASQNALKLLFNERLC